MIFTSIEILLCCTVNKHLTARRRWKFCFSFKSVSKITDKCFWMCNHEKISLISAEKSSRSKVSCLFSIVFIWFPSSAVGNQRGVDTWHRARIVACLLMNKIPPSYCSSLQAFMLNFGLCNLLVERWYRSRDGTKRLHVSK